jgi:hypothetical protein
MKSSFQSRSTFPNNRATLPTYTCYKLSIRGLLESPDAALCRARNNVSALVTVEVHLSGLSGQDD